MRYAVIFRDEEGNWIAEVPTLPGCVSQGETREEAISNIREAIELYLTDLDEARRDIYQDYIEPELVAIEMVAQ